MLHFFFTTQNATQAAAVVSLPVLRYSDTLALHSVSVVLHTVGSAMAHAGAGAAASEPTKQQTQQSKEQKPTVWFNDPNHAYALGNPGGPGSRVKKSFAGAVAGKGFQQLLETEGAALKAHTSKFSVKTRGRPKGLAPTAPTGQTMAKPSVVETEETVVKGTESYDD